MNDIHDMLRDAMPDLPAPPWPLIGEGLWSSVHDLGDGTVLKLVRRQTSGLGSGVAIHRREALALTALDGLATARLSVPALVAEGAFDGGAMPAGCALRVSTARRRARTASSMPMPQRATVSANGSAPRLPISTPRRHRAPRRASSATALRAA